MSEPQKKVMVVDDDPGILEALDFMLRSSGYDVKTVARGDEVVEAVRSFGPDIILLDLFLSGFDGRDVAIEVKGTPEGKDVPIVIISAHPSAADTVKTSPIQGFLAKPFDVGQLLSVIKKHTEKKTIDNRQ